MTTLLGVDTVHIFLHLTLVLTTHSMCIFEDTTSFFGTITSVSLADCPANASIINLSDKTIMSIDIGAFDSFWQVESLNVSRNELRFLHTTQFHFLGDLKILDLSYNKLSELHDGLFEDMTKLEMLNLAHNEIQFIGLNVFTEGLTNLSFIDLSYNYLTTIEPWAYVLPAIDGSAIVHLENNFISMITNYMNFTVSEKKNKRAVYFDFNNFTEWNDTIIFQLSNIQTEDVFSEFLRYNMNFSQNPWFCDCKFYGITNALRNSILRYMFIDEYRWRCAAPSHLKGEDVLHDIPLTSLVCNITENCPDGCFCQEIPTESLLMVDCRNAGLTALPPVLPYNRFHRLKLNLKNNSIEGITKVDYAKDIVHLIIADNELSYCDYDMFINMELVESLDLKNNNLQTIPSSIQRILFKYVQLTGNRLVCNCDMLWMSKWTELSDESDTNMLQCQYYDGTNYNVVEVTYDLLDCGDKQFIILGIFTGIVLIIVIVFLITAHRCPYETKVLLYKLFRIHPGDRYKVDRTEDKPHDAYIIFDDCDIHVKQWTMNSFRRKLEDKKTPYNIFVPYRDLLPGNDRADEITAKIHRSKRILIILSEHFMKNEWRLFECDQAGLLLAENENIVYIMYDQKGECLSREELWRTRIAGKPLLRREERLFWSKLKYELPLN